jgi:DNA-binding transcriptional LysR family regulator
MDVRQLRYFVSIVDYGSLGKAAEKLFVAQPSLSQQMARLEEELGVSLLLRSNHGVTPTAEGDALYRHARLVLRQMEQLKQEVTKGAGSESGTVAVGLPTTMASVLAVPLFERIQDRYPGIRLQFFESMSGYLNELLANGRLDLAILFRESDTPGISALPVLDDLSARRTRRRGLAAFQHLSARQARGRQAGCAWCVEWLAASDRADLFEREDRAEHHRRYRFVAVDAADRAFGPGLHDSAVVGGRSTRSNSHAEDAQDRRSRHSPSCQHLLAERRAHAFGDGGRAANADRTDCGTGRMRNMAGRDAA